MTPLTFEPRGTPRAIAIMQGERRDRGCPGREPGRECTCTRLRWVGGGGCEGGVATSLAPTSLAKRTSLFDLASNRAPSNNDDKTTTPLPFPPHEFVHAPVAPARHVLPHSAGRQREQACWRCRQGGWGAHGGGLGWDIECSEGSPLAA